MYFKEKKNRQIYKPEKFQDKQNIPLWDNDAYLLWWGVTQCACDFISTKSWFSNSSETHCLLTFASKNETVKLFFLTLVIT